MIRFITGTGGGCGKTVVAAALAWDELGWSKRVAYFKPVQTGRRSGDLGDADFVASATGIRAGEGLRYEEELSPAVAAELSRVPISVDALVDMARGEHYGTDVLLVEGNGGLLTPLSGDFTMADLARHIAADVVIVTEAGFGALNVCALTVEAARQRVLPVAGIVVSSWPEQPALVERTNLERLARYAPVLGVVPYINGLDTRDQRGPRAGAGTIELVKAPSVNG
jgi:dethiobiotin synthetase